MTKEELHQIKELFISYADAFIARAAVPFPLKLKKAHTLRVVEEMKLLIKDLTPAPELIPTLEASAVLHDLGRFPQFEIHGTFLDQVSVNHAELSLSEIETHGFLKGVSSRDRQLITTAVGHHNSAFLPGDLTSSETLHLKMLRDADKMDIWQVVIQNYQNPKSDRMKIIGLGLKKDGPLSREALDAIFQSTFIKSSMINNLNDLKLMQISWIFDLNFPCSICRAKNRGVIPKIVATMPPSRELSRVVDHVNQYMEKTCADKP